MRSPTIQQTASSFDSVFFYMVELDADSLVHQHVYTVSPKVVDLGSLVVVPWNVSHFTAVAVKSPETAVWVI